jgi:hypothetical protein
MHRRNPAVNDLGSTRFSREEIAHLRSDLILTITVERPNTSHTGEILHALQPGPTAATELFEDCAGVLNPRRRCEL